MVFMDTISDQIQMYENDGAFQKIEEERRGIKCNGKRNVMVQEKEEKGEWEKRLRQEGETKGKMKTEKESQKEKIILIYQSV